MARDLALDEIAELEVGSAAGIALPTDLPEGESASYTEAEIALLVEEEGFAVDEDSGYLNDASLSGVPGQLQKVLVTPRGNPLPVNMIDNSPSADVVNLYDTLTGQPYGIARASIRVYLNKVRPDGSKVFSTRPRVALPAKPFICESAMCLDGRRKKFATRVDRDDHYRMRHGGEYRRKEEERLRSNEDEARDMNRKLSDVLSLLALGKTNLSPEDVQAIAAANTAAGQGLTPDMTWGRGKILGWMEAKGIEYTAEHVSLVKSDLLVAIGAMERSELPAGLNEEPVVVDTGAIQDVAPVDEPLKRGPGRPRINPVPVGV